MTRIVALYVLPRDEKKYRTKEEEIYMYIHTYMYIKEKQERQTQDKIENLFCLCLSYNRQGFIFISLPIEDDR